MLKNYSTHFPRMSFFILFVVNWDENNNFTNIFSKFKDVEKVSSDIDEFTRRINILKKAGVKTGMPVRSLYQEFEHLDKSVINSGKSFLEGTGDLNTFSKACENAKSATSKFGTALKSIGANIAIMLAINLAIKAVFLIH